MLANRYLDAFAAGRLDRLDVAYTKFESLSRQYAVVGDAAAAVGQLAGAAEDEERRQSASRSTSSCPRPRAFSTSSCRPASR